MTVSNTTHNAQRDDRGALMKRLLGHKRQYAVGVLAVILSNAFSALPFYFIRLIIDGLSAGEAGGPLLGSQTLALYALGIVVSAAIGGALTLLMRRQIVVASRQIEYEIRRDLFAHLQTLDKAFFDRSRTGDLMNRLTSDLGGVREFLGFGVGQMANIFASSLVILTVMFGLDWQLALVVTVSIPLLLFILSRLGRLVMARHEAVQEQNSAIAAQAQENFSGARVVKAYAMEERELGRYRELNLELLRLNIELVKVEGPIRAIAPLLLGVVTAILLVMVASRMLAPESGFTVGMFVQFVGMLERLASPLMMAGWVLADYKSSMVSWSRLCELFAARPSLPPALEQTEKTPEGAGHLRFENVSLSYDGAEVLKDVTLDVPPGTFLAITGPTGSGKSSLGHLAMRLVDPTSGEITLDGRSLKTISAEELRRRVTVVPQEPFLFSDSIANNILFGLEDEILPTVETHKSVLEVAPPPVVPQNPDMARVEEAARMADLHGDISRFAEGYQTELGERGVTLSGGQRQRTAIARAIARKPQILLLDDSLSAVDTETERRILQSIREVARGSTVIAMAHRLSVLRGADRIVVLEHGRVVEEGTHEELLALGGHYAELERLQRSSELEEGAPA